MMSRLFSTSSKPSAVYISASQLASNLDKVSLLDIRGSITDPHYGPNSHAKIRPQGSFLCDLEGPVIDPAQTAKTGARHALPNIQQFIAFCEEAGIGRKPVVCFDDTNGAIAACRLFWMLDNFGLEAYVLDGGFHAYVQEKLPVVEGPAGILDKVAEPFAPGTAPYSNQKEWKNVVPIEYVDQVTSGQVKKLVIDARPPDRFGSKERPQGPDKMAGSIPSSINVPAPSNFTGAPGEPTTRLKSDTELQEKFKKLVASAPEGKVDNIICACGSGVTACVNIAMFRHTGNGTPKLYPGSWSEYGVQRRAQIAHSQVESQGFSVFFAQTAPGNKPVTQEEAVKVTVDGKEYSNAKSASEDISKSDENFFKAIAQVRVGEKGTIFTAKKNYEFSV